MTLWISLTVMGLVAVLFVAYPLYRNSKSFTPAIAVAVLLVSAFSIGLYGELGRPEVPSGGGTGTGGELEEIVAALAGRLATDPGDIEGWIMLGRSYMTLGDFAKAASALEKAVELESSQNAQTLVELGSALLSIEGSDGVSGRTAALFESALALEPSNPQALFYGGIGALNRGDTELAADRWERLLGLNPPEEIRGMLQQRVSEWRGEVMPAQAAPMQEAAPMQAEEPQGEPMEQAGVILRAAISVADSVQMSVPDSSAVYVIARDPAQPSPPIAVVRRRLSELPTSIDLTDANSMVPGRSLSMFSELEIVVRVSVTGQPSQQPGDWFTSAIVTPADNNEINLSIDTQVQ